MTEPMTYAELSEEYRMTMSRQYHQVRSDFYPAMRDLITASEKALTEAIDTGASETTIDALTSNFWNTKRLAESTVEARFMLLKRQVSQTARPTKEFTDEERLVIKRLANLEEAFTREVLGQ